MLVEEWDKQRGIRRPSHYAEFSWRKKERFLQAVAYHLALRGRKGSFGEDDLELVYDDIVPEFNLPPDEAQAVISEIESHTGLIQESGYRRYDFVHLVIQEFLTAMHAHRTANAIKHLIPGFPNEMALVVAYSTSPEQYLEQILTEALESLGRGHAIDLVVLFLSRLAIERPVWRPTARCGWVFLGYFDLVTRHLLQVDRQMRLHLPAEVVRLLREPGVAEAVAWAAAEAAHFETYQAVRLIPRPQASLPLPLADHLRGRSDPGILLLRSERTIQRILARRRKPATRRGRRPPQ